MSGDRSPEMRIALIGCGKIGRRRAEALRESKGGVLVLAVDRDLARAESVATDWRCQASVDWGEAIRRDDIGAVIVSTTHDALAGATRAAAEHGKHVLVEKPMARTPAEAALVCRALRDAQGNRRLAGDRRPLVVKVGFNHRFHPAISKAHTLLEAGSIGEPYFVRCRYGHGGRRGYADEWRFNVEIAGGGELLDQGIHAIDLFRWFLGDFVEGVGFTHSYFWRASVGAAPRGADVEDNAFGLFRTTSGRVATLHASWTQWKNLFAFEVFGRDGYLIVEGLGRSYGAERLTWGRRHPDWGSPDEEHFDFSDPESCWRAEWEEFLAAIREGREPSGNASDAWQAIRMAYAVYESSRNGGVVRLPQ
ncbi:MAG TPA: Gfo/Idh/MocA family oxidoreductase [bacterium]|nr:Gfo/Idh/MocA family oxidoreductase [bacterium]